MALKIAIIEDEHLAFDRLKQMVQSVYPDAHIYEQLFSIKKCIAFFDEKPQVDLVIMDIHLSDGKSFDIFNHTTIDAPIIFVTAYDEYALQAFKLNSIDYLMKPVKQEELNDALKKFDRYKLSNDILKELANTENKYIKQLNVKIGNKYFQIPTSDICSFYSKDKLSYVYTNEQKQYPIDISLDKIITSLDPNHFIRANRHLIVQRKNVKSFSTKEKSKLMLSVEPTPPVETNVSSEKSAEFKEWWKANY